MIGEPPLGQPVLPMVRGPDQLVVGLWVAGRCPAAPGQCAEPGLTLFEQRARPGSRSFQANAQVGGEGEGQVRVLRADRGLVVAGLGVPPVGPPAAVVEGWLAIQRY